MNHSAPLVEHILAQLQPYRHQKRWVVAFSGGVDSAVLLHGLIRANQRLDKPLPIIGLHINHQLSESAKEWEQHCRQWVEACDLEFISKTVVLKDTGQGIEAAARIARYTAFEDFLQEGDCLLVGHHRNDQAETLLLRLFRGAGVRGLAAIPAARALGRACLLRPLLGLSRETINSYARSYQLSWIEDESNVVEAFDRNFLRHRIMPLLQQRWPAVIAQLAKTTERLSQTDQLLDEVAASDLASLDRQTARLGESLDFKALAALSVVRINNILRYWCRQAGYACPQTEHLQQIEQQFLSHSALLGSACVSWGGSSSGRVELRQFSGRLYLMPPLPPFKGRDESWLWEGKSSLVLGDMGNLQIVKEESGGALLLPQRNYTIRWRQGGERCTPSHRQHSQTVKKLLQEYRLETWLRDRVPLIYQGDELVAVGDLWVNRGYHVENSAEGLFFRWQVADGQ